MLIMPISDLHFEFHQDAGRHFVRELCAVNSHAMPDVLILAGDIATQRILKNSLKMFADSFKHVVYVTGNHEYYNSDFKTIEDIIRDVEDTTKNFHWLQNKRVEIDGKHFAGATLWFEANEDSKGAYLKSCINDFRLIEKCDPIAFERFEWTEKFLRTKVMEGDIVVTHHLPSQKSVAARFKNSLLNCYFVAEVDHVILENKPALWIHGHTHDSCDYNIGPTRIVCNPYGYFSHEENPKFKDNLLITV